MSDAPNAWKVQQALSVWNSARNRLLTEDAELARDEASLQDLLGSEEGEVQDILARLLRASVHATSMMDAAASRIEEMQGRFKRYQNRANSLRATAFSILDAIGQSKVELPDLVATVRRGNSSVVITDEAAVPDIYVETVVTRKIDKAVLLSMLRSGGDVPGAELSNGLSTLAIRRR